MNEEPDGILGRENKRSVTVSIHAESASYCDKPYILHRTSSQSNHFLACWM